MSVEGTKKIGKLAFEIDVQGHKIICDVAEKIGGENRAPDPHGLMEAALAACTSITLQMYANRKAIPLESSDVRVTIKQEGEQNIMTRDILLVGDLNDEQKESLLKIANKCPIHNFLERGTTIETKLI